MTALIETAWRTPWLLLGLTALMWGGNAVAGQLAVGHISPPLLVALRWLLVAAVIVPLFWSEIREHAAVVRPRLVWIILAALAGYTGFNTLFYFASEATTGLNIGILQGSMPVLVMLGAFFVYGERVTGAQALGVCVTLVGVVVIAARGSWEVLATLAFNSGDLVMLAACVLYSGYTVALRNRPAIPGRALFAIMSVVAFAVSLPLAVTEYAVGDFAWPTAQGWMVTVFVAIFPSCLAQLFFMRGVDLVGPGLAGVYVNVVPIFASILAILILGEVFSWFHAVALVLVLTGIWIAQRKTT